MEEKNTNTCTACTCSCEVHKEHNHPTDHEGHDHKDEAKVCSSCGSKHADGGTCAM